MRFIRFLLIIFLSLAFRFSYAQQAQPEESLTRSLPKTHIYPNPAVGGVEYVHIKFEELLAEKTQLALHNIIGNKMEVETEVVDKHELRVRIKDLASGYYLISVKNGSQTIGSYKFLLKR